MSIINGANQLKIFVGSGLSFNEIFNRNEKFGFCLLKPELFFYRKAVRNFCFRGIWTIPRFILDPVTYGCLYLHRIF